MKKVLSLVLPVLLICGCKGNNQTKTVTHNYHEIKDNLIDFSDIFIQVENDYLVYFYSERCGHCKEIKDDIISYYLKGIRTMYFVCTDYDAVIGNPKDLTGIDNIDEFYIFGTPFLIRVFDYKVKEYYAGTKAILSYLDN